MHALMTGEVPDAQVAGWLVAYRARGARGSELAEMAAVLAEHAVAVPDPPVDLVDTCGTGGGSPSFNLSTAAAFIACGAGAKVAKHGNRAVTSACGSADVLEALGAKIDLAPERSSELLRTLGFAFLFAPLHHPAMRHVGPVRRALGVRTVFNFLGPLANPARAKRQVIGVYDPRVAPAIAEAASLLGAERVWVVHGDDGLDEVSPCASTRVWGTTDAERIHLEAEGIPFVSAEALAPGADAEASAAILREAVTSPDSPRFAAALPSAAAVLVVGGLAKSMREGADLARQSVAEGRARRALEAYVEESRR